MLLDIADRGTGILPVIDVNSSKYQVAYFTNAENEQRIYVFDKLTKKAIIYCSDDWERPMPIDLHPCTCCEHASHGEQLWLQACTAISREIIENRANGE